MPGQISVAINSQRVVPCLRAVSATVTPGIMLSAAIRARSAFVRRRRPLGPPITSSRETPTPIEPSNWTPILPSLSKSKTSAAHVQRRMKASTQKWQEGIGVALTDMQRRAQIGLNKGEAHHALKNALRIGRQGEE